MITIDETNIAITRGDSAYIQFNITDMSGNPITLTENDIVRSQVRKKPNDGDLIIDGDIIRNNLENTIIWHIRPEDTKDCEVGNYYWDAQVEYPNGDIFTFVPVSKFRLLSEVTLDRQE